MQRGPTGHFEETTTAGERVRAFVPNPLPPEPPIDLSGTPQAHLDAALLACGRLDGVSALLPDPDLFLYAYVRREAVLSSQIEGTQSSLSDLLLFELEDAPGAPMNDVVEVSNYVTALQHGITRVREGFPLSSRLLRETHEILLSRGRGAGKLPGEFRRTQNWIGGTRPGNAAFVPPPPGRIADAMGHLERYVNDAAASPPLIRAALAHVQFETIHPFLDGNGRVGRLMIPLILHEAGILHQPLLYLSLYFKQHRAEYYRLLDIVRRAGDWEAWLSFFLQGVASTATDAVATAHRLLALFEEDEQRVRALEIGRVSASVLQVLAAIRQRPVASIQDLSRRSRLTIPTVTNSIRILVKSGIAAELTGRKRNRVFAYQRLLQILNEGAEPLRGQG
ncbi:MAG: Fic family protein [Steroidobacteraceae bacterium]